MVPIVSPSFLLSPRVLSFRCDLHVPVYGQVYLGVTSIRRLKSLRSLDTLFDRGKGLVLRSTGYLFYSSTSVRAPGRRRDTVAPLVRVSAVTHTRRGRVTLYVRRPRSDDGAQGGPTENIGFLLPYDVPSVKTFTSVHQLYQV